MTAHSTPTPFTAGAARSLQGARRAGAFTLVEVLVAIGILVLLITIIIPVIGTARARAARNRAQRDLQALRTGLEEYKNNFNEYPGIGLGQSTTGQQALYCALVGRTQSGTNANVPITNSRSGRPATPMINVENFHAKFIDATNGWLICDDNDLPYLYFRAAVPMPDIRSTKGGFVSKTPTVPPALYTFSDCVPTSPVTMVTFQYAHFQRLLGDDTGNNIINGPEQPSTTGPYLLWAAGEDKTYGLDSSASDAKSDDITNFPLPMKYQK